MKYYNQLQALIKFLAIRDSKELGDDAEAKKVAIFAENYLSFTLGIDASAEMKAKIEEGMGYIKLKYNF